MINAFKVIVPFQDENNTEDSRVESPKGPEPGPGPGPKQNV